MSYQYEYRAIPSADLQLVSSPLIRSFHDLNFTVGDLVTLKRDQSVSVAVVIPALNEQDTVGEVVRSIALAQGLVDELIVVDGGSDDATAAAAAEAGARVVRQSDVRPDVGTGRGKGDAMWRGLASTTSDLVAFVDADIRNPDWSFAGGPLGVLLAEPEIDLVKAAYDRPFEGRSSGGGRVTELMARPVLAAFWPELAGLVQPLSGEYAGRRTVLERVPFVSGYGVELALLIDVLGLGGTIAQVDLGERVHAHQDLNALGRMAAEILHVAMSRLEREGRATLPDLAKVLPQAERSSDGTWVMKPHDINVDELPPIAS